MSSKISTDMSSKVCEYIRKTRKGRPRCLLQDSVNGGKQSVQCGQPTYDTKTRSVKCSQRQPSSDETFTQCHTKLCRNKDYNAGCEDFGKRYVKKHKIPPNTGCWKRVKHPPSPVSDTPSSPVEDVASMIERLKRENAELRERLLTYEKTGVPSGNEINEGETHVNSSISHYKDMLLKYGKSDKTKRVQIARELRKHLQQLRSNTTIDNMRGVGSVRKMLRMLPKKRLRRLNGDLHGQLASWPYTVGVYTSSEN